MSAKYDPILGKVREKDEGKGGGGGEGQSYTEEKLILQSTSFIPYATPTRKRILSIKSYLCSDVKIDGVTLAAGGYLEADTVYSISATMTADNAIIILKTEEA